MIKVRIALLLLVYSAALAAEPGVSDTSGAAAIKQICDRQVAGQGENSDWAFIDRYRNASAELIGARIRPNVVFIGDSITEFWANQPDFTRDSARVGRGISGQSSAQILLRFRTDVINLKPQVVHIMAGTNDIAENTGRETDEEIEGYISNMVELAQLHGIKVAPLFRLQRISFGIRA
jgi:lysophospholipase L1-like esterase